VADILVTSCTIKRTFIAKQQIPRLGSKFHGLITGLQSQQL